MRTASVDSRLVDILQKIDNASKHLAEAASEATSLPQAESQRARGLITPARKAVDGLLIDFRGWVDQGEEK